MHALNFKNKIYNKCLLLYVKFYSSKADWTGYIHAIKIVFRHSKFFLLRAWIRKILI